jgi:hypothetical protein
MGWVEEGAVNTPDGLLSWTGWHDKVIAPAVYPKYPYVRRQLSLAKLLVALDVPSMRVKQVDAGTTLEWIRLLHLPLKVCAEVCEWLYELLRVGGRKR